MNKQQFLNLINPYLNLIGITTTVTVNSISIAFREERDFMSIVDYVENELNLKTHTDENENFGLYMITIDFIENNL